MLKDRFELLGREVRVDTVFTCPRCGGSYFGTTGHPKTLMVGHCHGINWRPCNFTWPRSEDFRYMRFSFQASCEEDFEALYAALQA